MHSTRPLQQRLHRGERGATSIEFVGLAVAVAVLLGGMSHAMGGAPAAAITRAIPDRITQALQGGSVRTAHERRAGSGDNGTRISRDDLRLDPLVPELAVKRGTLDHTTRIAGFDVRVEGSACALCVQVGERHSLVTGAMHDGSTGGGGVQATAQVNARAALFAGDIGVRLQRSIGLGFGEDALVTGEARAHGTIGAEADAKAKLIVTPTTQSIELGGSAVAGAAAKGEARLGLKLLGISIQQTTRGEGWAGAGARGKLTATHTGSSLAWDTDWGAALGLGGSFGWGGTIDVSGLKPEHRKLAASLISQALQLARPALLDRTDTTHPKKDDDR